ncbi:hypothetical protein [Sporolactobacillus pectinivorans]|uniref:hypothetical protein n=1 Tax=Sporolactobacillus pectinivorans TaxID=1591408 RepID=UPI000C25AA6F|nr:hypothetical protein [Sporolactobacillus pectinivorans]
MEAEDTQKNPLNQLRRSQPDRLGDTWSEWCRTDRQHAFTLINDPQLEFPVLFMLKDQLEERDTDLELRPRIALSQIQNVLHGADLGINEGFPFSDQHDLVVVSMLWILQSGWNNIISTDYTQVIDQTAIQILHTYHQDWIKGMTNLIFYRYKNKSQRHYLISALLEIANPVSLVYQANFLLSDQNVESDYARRMLSFIPEVRHTPDNKTAFLSFETWYEENEHYLVYTGETNDAVPGGHPYRIHYSAKYLGKAVDAKSGEPIQEMLPGEKRNYTDFLKLPGKVQMSLSTGSARLRKQQPKSWRAWINQPIPQQLASLNISSGGGERR